MHMDTDTKQTTHSWRHRMKCEECGKKTKECFLSNNPRYKIWICRKCKLKEDNDTASIKDASLRQERVAHNEIYADSVQEASS